MVRRVATSVALLSALLGARGRRVQLAATRGESGEGPAQVSALLDASEGAGGPGRGLLGPALLASLAAARGGHQPFAFVGPAAPARQVQEPQHFIATATALGAQRDGPKAEGAARPKAGGAAQPKARRPPQAKPAAQPRRGADGEEPARPRRDTVSKKERGASEAAQGPRRRGPGGGPRSREAVLSQQQKDRAAGGAAAKSTYRSAPTQKVDGARRDRPRGVAPRSREATLSQQAKDRTSAGSKTRSTNDRKQAPAKTAERRGRTPSLSQEAKDNIKRQVTAKTVAQLEMEEHAEFYSTIVQTLNEALVDNPLDTEWSQPDAAVQSKQAPTLLTSSWMVHKLHLPTDWAEPLDMETISVTDKGRRGAPFYVGHTSVKSAFEEVAFEIGLSSEAETARELRALELLSPTGCVPMLYDYDVSEDGKTYLLMEAPLAYSLKSYVATQKQDRAVLPIDVSVQLMVSMLRGLRHMEDAGVVHGNIDEENILVQIAATDGGPETIFTDFRRANFVGLDSDPLLGHGGAAGLLGSPYRTAPEAELGRPAGPAGNVWQLGLVLARMLLPCGLPTEDAVSDLLSTRDMRRFAFKPKGRDKIRSLVREHFSVGKMQGFSTLSMEAEDVAEILAGMLESDPAERWTVARALEAAEAAAARRGVLVPAARAPAHLPADWSAAASE